MCLPSLITINESLRRIHKEEGRGGGECNITSIAFWPKIHNPNIMIRNHQTLRCILYILYSSKLPRPRKTEKMERQKKERRKEGKYCRQAGLKNCFRIRNIEEMTIKCSVGSWIGLDWAEVQELIKSIIGITDKILIQSVHQVQYYISIKFPDFDIRYYQTVIRKYTFRYLGTKRAYFHLLLEWFRKNIYITYTMIKQMGKMLTISE